MNEVTTGCQAVTIELSEAQALEYLLKIAELTARRQEIVAVIEKRVENLTREVTEYNAEISFLEDSVKGFVKARAKSLKGEFLEVIYSKGRTSWDTKALDGYATINKEILQFKKTGDPSASIKSVKVTKQITL
jgi:hypothetical protein